jgi:hypothetical protein
LKVTLTFGSGVLVSNRTSIGTVGTGITNFYEAY